MKCEVIRDLLPLYCDGLTSPESNALIEEHLRGCEGCAQIYENLHEAEKIPAAARNIEPLQKLRRSAVRKGIFGFLAGACTLGLVFCFAFVGIIPARSSEVEVAYTAAVEENGDLSISMDFSCDEGHGLRFRTTKPDGDDLSVRVTPARILLDPFEDETVQQNQFTLGWQKSKGSRFTDADVVTVHFLGRDAVYNLREIAEETGIQ